VPSSTMRAIYRASDIESHAERDRLLAYGAGGVPAPSLRQGPRRVESPRGLA
jgi:hypothetical protein